jgi:hypothetical protein
MERKSYQKLIYLEGMGGPTYPLNTCEVYFNLPLEKGEIECQILWGHPSCPGCPRDKVLARFGLLEPEPGQRGAQLSS